MSASIAEQVYDVCKKHIGEFSIVNGQVKAKLCPFCHGGKTPDTDTFYVGLYNGAYNCLRGSCNAKGSFKQLCEKFGEKYTPNENTAFQTYTSIRSNKVYSRPNPSVIQPLTDEIVKYFEEARSISRTTLEAFKVGATADGNIVFPFYRNGELVMVKYRKPMKVKSRKEWTEASPEPILFNMDNVSFNKPLYITEGQIDAMALFEAGISNVVSVPMGCNNLDWISNCWDWLEQFQQIAIFGDSDEPGIELAHTLMRRLGEDRCLLAPEYPELVYRGKDYNRLCKDADEILICYGKEVLADYARRCEPAPVKGILNLADVQMEDPANVVRLMTKIKDLDIMTGGLREGSLMCVSGKRGSGKSTLGGLVSLNAIQQNYKVCAYSGELSAKNYLNWIMHQATERKYFAVKTDSRSGKLYTTIPMQIQTRIKDWINGNFFLFDNNSVDPGESEFEAMMKVFTICARRLGCKLFICDNLMSLVAGADEELKAQTRVVADLKKFAVKYNVMVMLFAHPRKEKLDQAFTNDSIAGSANITNLADVVVNVEKPSLRVTKNREFGDTGYIECSYDPASRRIFQSDIGDNISYGWDHDNLDVVLNEVDKFEEFKVREKEHYPTNPF